MWTFIEKGGPLMYPILLGLLVGLAIIIEKAFNLRASRIVDRKLFLNVKERLGDRDYEMAIAQVKAGATPAVAELLEEAIRNRELPEDELRELIESSGKHAVRRLERYLPTLSTIISIEPLLGLLGTVTGMIKVFKVISTQGIGRAELLAGGISEALITTAAGLSIAIPFLIFYNMYSERAESIAIELEKEVLSIFKRLKSS
ncbi:MAG: MotA/TolQ/ExbB proton channel family protein [Acidobacteria bacterium]|nr:MAG: MotA/TolQ/ExbB proton channel family protein [Acidobacteriota bacterium]RLE24286.1 MAG: MotA/TolQ/ExbB proton channel family protein [Acidobacteriota bacterium]